MSIQICVFEDNKYDNFLPLTLTRPVYELKCGIDRLRDKLFRLYPQTDVSLFCRENLAGIVKQENPEFGINRVSGQQILFLNGRLLADTLLTTRIPLTGDTVLYRSGESVAAVRCSLMEFQEMKIAAGVPITMSDWKISAIEDVEVNLVEYCWDLLEANADQIESDSTQYSLGSHDGNIYAGVHLLNPENIFIGKGSIIKPGSVLDGEKGPIIIDENVHVMPNAVIIGPVYIGPNSLVKPGARISGPVSLGETCKVGGELGSCIIQGNSNKQHDGYLGNAYLGEWINLGADTNNSDLKNTYSNVTVTINGNIISTGRQFFGLVMGDHSKTAINTQLNTGSVIGICCTVFGAGFPPKYIPSFSWGGRESLVTHNPEKALQSAVKVMNRRDIKPGSDYLDMLKAIYDDTSVLRNRFGVK